jgi:hypothetical protein
MSLSSGLTLPVVPDKDSSKLLEKVEAACFAARGKTAPSKSHSIPIAYENFAIFSGAHEAEDHESFPFFESVCFFRNSFT